MDVCINYLIAEKPFALAGIESRVATMAPGRFFDGHIFDGHIIDGHIIDGTYYRRTYFRPVIKWTLFRPINKMGHIFDGTYFRRDIFSTGAPGRAR